MQISENIRLLREQKGLSQERLAEMTGIPRGTIANIEKNWNEPMD